MATNCDHYKISRIGGKCGCGDYFPGNCAPSYREAERRATKRAEAARPPLECNCDLPGRVQCDAHGPRE